MKKHNVNSFADNMNKFVKNTNNSISILNGLSDAITSNEDVVNINIIDGEDIQLPTYQNMLRRLKNVETTVETFTKGNGSVKLIDGTNRQIKVDTMPSTPNKIENITTPTIFKTNANWFFESLMFPKLVVSIDLVDKVDNDSDRVLVNRVIINDNSTNLSIYNENILNKNLHYNDLITLLNDKNISFFEDLETLYFPLKSEKYNGLFPISKIEIIDGKKWYYLSEIEYTSNDNINSYYNLTLTKGDTLKYDNSLFEIEQIDLTSKRVLLKNKIGLDIPTIGSEFSFYVSPFASKEIDIPIGANEINCIYFKGVNEHYNLLGNEWSDCVSFITNDLVNEGGDTLKNYYQKYVADFGAEWISYAKEKKIPAYSGLIPNTPTLNASDFKVVQINTQINATLDNEKINSLSTQITSIKSSIESSRNTIAKLKANLTTETNANERYNIQKLITNEEITLSSNTSEYKSLCDELKGFVKENNINSTSPKYRVRGFFDIPEAKYLLENDKTQKQEIIGFDIKYRYIKKDETGVDLGTYTYKSGNVNINATFSDWNIVSGQIKEKIYNEELDIFEWQEENVGDGNTININQIDIPINDGEKVEFMVRSISEAGYPNCPKKSPWSNSVIISFPANLSSSNQLSNLIEDVNSDSNSIQLNEVLNSAGFYSHISDETISPDDGTKTYHHNAENIYYRKTNVDGDSEYISTVSVASMIKKLEEKIKNLEEKINKLESK